MKQALSHFLIPLILLSNITSIKAQDTLIDNSLYFRLTVGGGSGGSKSIKGNGIGGTIEFAIQKRKAVFAAGIKGIEEFNLLSGSNVIRSISGADVTYGRVWKRNTFYSSISAGISWVISVQEGKLLSRQGGWLFGSYTYEKLTYNNLGFPISAKIFWVPARFYGIGAELFVNINKYTFYGVNFCHQFGKLSSKK